MFHSVAVDTVIDTVGHAKTYWSGRGFVSRSGKMPGKHSTIAHSAIVDFCGSVHLFHVLVDCDVFHCNNGLVTL